MSSEKPSAAAPDDKPADNLVETPTRDDEKGGREGADYSGAVAKSSPEEIQLVRKLDWRIMPTLWAMYFLNYVRSTPQIPARKLADNRWDSLTGTPLHRLGLTAWKTI